MTPWLIFGAKAVGGLACQMGVGPAFTIVERRVAAWIQGRVGPNRVGPLGLFQPLADLVKFISKEQIVPADADRVLFLLGPLLVFAPPIFGFCVIPYGNMIGDEHLQIANLPIGVLFVMSVISTGVYGMMLGGWASNNKYALLGSLRASAQIISYELSLGLAILIAVMMSSSLDLNVIVEQQAGKGFGAWNVFGGGHLSQLPSGLLGFGLMFICALAENNRLPFDLSECEAELVGGYHTEYSSMSLGVFMLSEYLSMILMCGLMTSIYLGGWSFPGITDPSDHSILAGLISWAVFMTKILSMMFVYVWIRWTLPRFKYNQLMDLGWKAFLPASLVNIALLAVIGVMGV